MQKDAQFNASHTSILSARNNNNFKSMDDTNNAAIKGGLKGIGIGHE